MSFCDKEGKEICKLEGGDTSSAPVTGLQSDIVESATFHEDVPAGKEVDKVKELFEMNTENMIDEGPGKDIITDLKQEQVDTNFAASTESHDEIVADKEVQEINKVTLKQGKRNINHECNILRTHSYSSSQND